jgi:16S rRNA (cytosine967-C5)-methyltransferase
MRSPRTVAATAIAAVISRRVSLTDALESNASALTGRDRALAHEIAFGVCRRYFELDGMLRQLMAKPLKPKDADIHALMLVGLYQMRHMRVPDHAAVAETVAATHQLKKRWASGLVNAVLRSYQSREAALIPELSEAQRLCHPDWLLNRIRQAWPEHWQAIIAANNEAPETCLRVNRRRSSRDEWLAHLIAQGVDARAGELSPDAIVLARGMDVEKIPGFAQGVVSVQDQAAQLAAPLLRCEPHQRVLDACAAPGGKTAHLLEMLPLDLVSLDVNDGRLARVAANLRRLELTSRVMHGDATAPLAWWDKKPFDRVLLDAPCSATGVIRRHPDIKVLRSEQQVHNASREQRALLAGVWPSLAEGGLLLYCTCSILPQENEMLVASFLRETPHAQAEPLDVPWGIEREVGRQLLPVPGSNDGFYYALLRKGRRIDS